MTDVAPNSLSVTVFVGLSTTPRPDPDKELSLVEVVSFRTLFPFGLYGPASLFIPRPDATRRWGWKPGDRVVIENGLEVVWEGKLSGMKITINKKRIGLAVSCAGSWGAELGKQTINKRWADDRLSEWRPAPEDQFTRFDLRTQDNTLTAVCKSLLYTVGDLMPMGRYWMPTGETVKRVTFDYNLQETAVVSPRYVKFNNDFDNVNSFSDLNNTCDGDLDTQSSITLEADDYLYIQRPEGVEIDGFRLIFGSGVNNNAATLTVQRYTGEAQDTTPLSVKHWNGSVYTTLTNAFDGNAGTGVNVTMGKGDFLYIRTSESKALGLRFDFGASVNNNIADMSLQRFNGTSWSKVSPPEEGPAVVATGDSQPFGQDGTLLFSETAETESTTIDSVTGLWWRITFNAALDTVTINEIYVLSGWQSVSISDGTAVAGAPFAQGGEVTFTYPADEAEVRVDGSTGFWWRIKASAALDATDIKEIYVIDRQAWKVALYNNVTAADEWSVVSSGSGSADVTFATPDSDPGFYFQSQAKQQGVANGSVFASISNIVVYSETGSINITEIVKDVHGLANNLNSDVADIKSNTLAVVPFVTGDYESLASVLERVAAFGDGSQNSWNVYLKSSDQAAAPNGKPVLALEQYPALTDHDYVINIEDENLAGGIDVDLDSSNQANYIIVRYRDALSSRTAYVTPDDDSTLKDDTSIADYGEMHAVIDAGEATLATAVAFGRRYLKEYKNPKFYVSGPIKVVGSIRAKNKQTVPAANIQAGKRLRIENFLHDLYVTTDVVGLVEIISETEYSDRGQVCQISLGVQDDVGLFLARTLVAAGGNIGGPLGRPQFGI